MLLIARVQQTLRRNRGESQSSDSASVMGNIPSTLPPFFLLSCLEITAASLWSNATAASNRLLSVPLIPYDET